MGILDRLLKTEQKIRRRIERSFGDGSAQTPLEVRREILEQVESRIMPDRGGKIFPFGGVVVRLRPRDPAMREIFQAAFVDDGSLENETRELLRSSGVRIPDRFHVAVQFDQPAPEPPDGSLSTFALEFVSADNISERPRPAARLLILKGAAEQPSYSMTKDRILIGRVSELLDREGQMARRNDIVFLDNGDEINSTVGRAHATVYFSRDKQEFRITDEVSRYGTRIFREGRSIEVPGGNPRGIRLRSGDEIYLGRACLRFEEVKEG
jgi:hypothetical protein